MSSPLLTPLDLYCERLDPSFWAEPLNAWSNLGFLLAAGWLYRLAGRTPGGRHWQVNVLVALVAAIGVGSFLFHTLALYWAMLADVIPIFIYQLLFLVFYLQRVARLRSGAVAAWVGVFLLASVGASALPVRWLNGSLSYAPALLFVSGLAVFHWRRQMQARGALMWAALAFSAALACRCLDMAVCEAFPWGTHHAWHGLNAVVLCASTLAYVRNAFSPPGRPTALPPR